MAARQARMRPQKPEERSTASAEMPSGRTAPYLNPNPGPNSNPKSERTAPEEPGGGPSAATSWAQSANEATTAASALFNMHANAQLAYILGTAARYEATGEPHARLASEAFWRSMQRGFVYLSGGSSFQEAWGTSASSLGDSLVHRGNPHPGPNPDCGLIDRRP